MDVMTACPHFAVCAVPFAKCTIKLMENDPHRSHHSYCQLKNYTFVMIQLITLITVSMPDFD